jgi:uncharacterized SAM-binding protein YcdF (DUF218 family)
MKGLSARKRMRSGRKRRFIALLLIVLCAAWFAGLFAFAGLIPRTPEDSNEPTDAIVVLTGGSMRMEEGLALLSRQMGKKLFVSGVHRGVEVKQLIDRSRRSPQEIDCCIVLGYTADHTAGNARETADWMRQQGYRSLRLVTASYHMPRSLAEFRQEMPNIKLIPHPVFPEHVKLDEWWRWPGTALLIVGEYNKYLVAVAFHSIKRLLNGATGQ